MAHSPPLRSPPSASAPLASQLENIPARNGSSLTSLHPTAPLSPVSIVLSPAKTIPSKTQPLTMPSHSSVFLATSPGYLRHISLLPLKPYPSILTLGICMASAGNTLTTLLFALLLVARAAQSFLITFLKISAGSFISHLLLLERHRNDFTSSLEDLQLYVGAAPSIGYGGYYGGKWFAAK